VIGIRGKIALISSDRGFVGVQTENGDYSVIELLGGYDVELGDEVTGDFHSYAGESIKNITQSETMDVSVEAHGLNREQARSMLRSFAS
jgi:hypothetical protein